MKRESCGGLFASRLNSFGNRPALILWPFLAAALCNSCGSKSEKVDIFIEDGVEIVQNHLQPYTIPGEPRNLTMKRLYSIDTNNDKISALGLTDIQLIDVDSTGTIFVCRPPAGPGDLIYEFSSQGEFVRSFGRLGQGPNELEYPSELIARRGRVGIVESVKKRITYFGPDGASLGVASWDLDIDELRASGTTGYLAQGQIRDDTKARFLPLYLGLADAGLKSVKELERYSAYPNLRMAATFPDKIINGLGNVFLGAVAGDRIFAGSDERGYEIRAYDFDGKLIRKVRKEYAAVPVPEEFRKRVLGFYEGMAEAEKLYFPEAWPPFRAFFGDDEGRLFVMTREPGTQPGESTFDIYDREGRLIARKSMNIFCFDFPRALALVRGNRLYSVQENAEGYKALNVDEMVWGK